MNEWMNEYSVAKLRYRPTSKVPKPQSCNLLWRCIGNANHIAITYAVYTQDAFAYSAMQAWTHRHRPVLWRAASTRSYELPCCHSLRRDQGVPTLIGVLKLSWTWNSRFQNLTWEAREIHVQLLSKNLDGRENFRDPWHMGGVWNSMVKGCEITQLALCTG